MNEENVATRLKLFMDSLGLSNSQFADRCNIPRPSLSQLLTGRNKKVSDVLVGQIHQAFPELSILWLMFGEGEMLSSSGIDGENGSDVSEFPYSESDGREYSKENGLGLAQKVGQMPGNKDFNGMKTVSEINGKIAENRENPRKVVQITVYYDDSTFETFVPGR